MGRRFRIREVCVVADRGMISDDEITALESTQPPVRKILGVLMRRPSEVSEKILNFLLRSQLMGNSHKAIRTANNQGTTHSVSS